MPTPGTGRGRGRTPNAFTTPVGAYKTPELDSNTVQLFRPIDGGARQKQRLPNNMEISRLRQEAA